MNKFINRRQIILGTILSYYMYSSVVHSSQKIPIHVYKDSNCGCCKKWIEILENNDFSVTSEDMFPSDLVKLKVKNNIPMNMISCHTAKVFDYFIEGHVPPSDIKSLINKKVDVIGLAVPGMPYGSPGMGPEDKREAFDVFLISKDGSKVYNHYDSKN